MATRLGALSIGWCDGLAAILALVKASGDHVFSAHIVMIPKELGDASPIGKEREVCYLSFTSLGHSPTGPHSVLV